MLFVNTDDLKVGMRLAKPIYNKNGVLLYERNTKLTMQGIYSVKNFGLIGLYILEPAEPLPPMSKEDVEFERFQTMAVFSIKDDMQLLLKGKKPAELVILANQIVRNYGRLDHKINFTQNLRSPEDYVYKHALNVAILSALITHKLGVSGAEQLHIVEAALLYDIGRLTLPIEIQNKSDSFNVEEFKLYKRSQIEGLHYVSDNFDIADEVKKIVSGCHKNYDLEEEDKNKKLPLGIKVIQVAHYYDTKTAMNLYERPTSEITVIRALLSNTKNYELQVVNAMLDSIHILSAGVCVELVSGEKGLVIRENEKDPLRPMILGFEKNQVYDLSYNSTYTIVKIKDLMKTMDNRIVVDKKILNEYLNR